MRVPTRSAGTRSGVNWTRRKLPPTTWASVFTVSVFASPGTPSSSTWPPARSATSSRSSIASWPTITRFTSYSPGAACEDPHEQPLEHRVLAHDHPLHLAQRLLQRGARVLAAGGRIVV